MISLYLKWVVTNTTRLCFNGKNPRSRKRAGTTPAPASGAGVDLVSLRSPEKYRDFAAQDEQEN
jgi:hypothetical protein